MERACKDLKQTWRVRDVFYVLIIYFVILLFFLFVETKIFGKDILDDKSLNPVILFFEDIGDALIFSLLPIFFVSKFYEVSLKEIGITFKAFKRNLAIGLLIGFVLWGIVSIFDLGIKSIWSEVPKHPYLQKLEMSSNPLSYFALLFSIVVLGPLSEEIYFRGFVYTIFKKHYSKVIALVLSSLIFVGVHFNLYWAVQIFIAGVGLALLFERTGSLVSVVTAHAVINLCSMYIGNS